MKILSFLLRRDTLIRLYPLRFWIDATVTVGIFTILGGVGLGVGGWFVWFVGVAKFVTVADILYINH